MKEKKLFSSIDGIDSKFVNEALETMSIGLDGEEAEIFEPLTDTGATNIRKTSKTLLLKAISLAAGMCAVAAAVFALNNFSGQFNLIPAQTVGSNGTADSGSEAVSESGLIDATITEETTEEEKEIIIDKPINGLPEVTSPVYAAAEKYFTVEKATLPMSVSSYDLLVGDKIFFRESSIDGKEAALIYSDIMTGKEEVLLQESSEYGIYYYPVCEYNGYLYFYHFIPYDENPFALLKIGISDKTVETVIDSMTFNANLCSYPPTVCSGNMLYIEKTVRSEKYYEFSYNIDMYNMDTGEVSTFKEQARCPRVFKDGVAYLVNNAIYMCDAVTGENEKKICDREYDWESYENLIYSDGETLFRIESQEYDGEDTQLSGKSYFTFDVFNGEKFEPIAIFFGGFSVTFPESFIYSEDFIVFETYFGGKYRMIIYDKKSGEFIKLESENGYIDFYSSGDSLYYAKRVYKNEELVQQSFYKLTRN